MPPKRKFEEESYESIEARIQEVLEILEERGEEKPNIAGTAREFELPPQRLRARWNGRQSKSDRPGSKRKLSEDQELAVCLYLDRLDAMGTCVLKKMVASCADAILARAHEDPDTQPPVVSQNWTKRFLKRHPEYFVRKQNTTDIYIDIPRKKAHDPEGVRKWFAEFKKICDQRGIQPRDIYNFDEIGFRIGTAKDQWVITRQRDRQVYPGRTTNRELVTVCETISADGDALPPMIIVRETHHQGEWYTNLPDHYLVGVSDTGSSNDEHSMGWLEHFDRFSARRCLGEYRLLLLNGDGSHCTEEFIDYCDEHKIIPLSLPPHYSHLLQPLDVDLFQLYKQYHVEAVEAATPTGFLKYDKMEFFDAIPDIRCRTFKPATIVSAFQKTGLVPYNPEIVLAKMREAAASVTTPPTTPPPRAQDTEAEPETPKTPLTVRSLKRRAEEVLLNAAVRGISPSFRRRMEATLKGAVVLAQAAEQAFSDLAAVTAAERSRDMLERREEEEVEKMEAAGRRLHEAWKRAQKAERKPFPDEVKRRRKEMKDFYAKRKTAWKVVFSELRKVGRARAKKSSGARACVYSKRRATWKVVFSELQMVGRVREREKKKKSRVLPLW